jgi:hypothetical protein
MGLFDHLTELLIFPSGVDERVKRKRSIFKTLSIILLITSVIWLVYELPFIQSLTKPYMFISIFVSLGISIILIFALFIIRVFKSIMPTDFLLIILSVSLNLVCATSYLNRQTNYKFMKKISLNKAEEYRISLKINEILK